MRRSKRAYPFKNLPGSVPKARYLVRTTLLGWEYGDDVIEPAMGITSELATNAVLHATESTLFEVLCELSDNLLTIGVIDYDERLPVKLEATTDDESGRGLLMVEALSDDWGWQPYEGGKLVFGRLHVVEPPPHVLLDDPARMGQPTCFT